MTTPCIIITRDRVSYLKACLASLERFMYQGIGVGYELDVHIVDHGSAYEPMLDYLNSSPFPVWRRGDQLPRDLWTWDGLRRIVGDGRRYLVTDPDVVVDDDCPGDWLCRMTDETSFNPMVKIGFGIRVDDLPDTQLGREARAWEAGFWLSRTRSGKAWNAPVDTTLALYPPLSVVADFHLGPAVRLDAPYLIRHLPWYGVLDENEHGYYRSRLLPGSSHWSHRQET